jgi:hypothetical protein
MNEKTIAQVIKRAEAVAVAELEEAVLRITTRLHSEPDQDPVIAMYAIGRATAAISDRMRVVFEGVTAGKPMADIAQSVGITPAVMKEKMVVSRADIERTARLLEVPFRLPEDEDESPQEYRHP